MSKRTFQEISEVDPVVPEGGGNTKPPPKKRCNLAKKWVFTWFGSKDIDFLDIENSKIIEFTDRLKEECDIASFQEEKCPKTLRHHLQGYVKFKTKKRPVSVFGDIDNTIHWEVMKGSLDQSTIYCQKENTKVQGGKEYRQNVPRMVDKVGWAHLSQENRDFLDPIIEEPFDYRTIHWVCDPKGGWGKSLIQKYLVDNHTTLMVAGAGKDMAYALKTYHEENDMWPDFVVCNLPKSTKEEYISYGMLEMIKDGLLFSGKYESGQLRFPPVKLIVFANMVPGMDEWSEDRVKLYHVNS